MRNDKKIMIIGAGDIGRRVFYAMAHSAQARHLVLAGRDAEAVTRFVNMTRFSALQCGFNHRELTFNPRPFLKQLVAQRLRYPRRHFLQRSKMRDVFLNAWGCGHEV